MCLRCSSITSFESHLNVFIHQNALHAHRATTLDHYYYVQIKMTKLFAQKYIYKNVLSHDHTERNSTCECECVDNNFLIPFFFFFVSSPVIREYIQLRERKHTQSLAPVQIWPFVCVFISFYFHFTNHFNLLLYSGVLIVLNAFRCRPSNDVFYDSSIFFTTWPNFQRSLMAI